MAQRARFSGLIILALIGLADSLYITGSEVTDTPLVCGINGLSGCNVVAQSPYAQLFGIPLGVYGVAFYALLFILAALPLVFKYRGAEMILFILTAGGAVSSLIFIGIQVFLIKALCIYCLVSAAVSFLAFAVALPLMKPALPMGKVPDPAVPAAP
jgi:uncharacterized membrane protein